MPDLADLNRRFDRIMAASRSFGDGGREVLEVAYHTLGSGHAIERWPDVGLEDLWAHAIQEGWGLFKDPKARWARTGPEKTRDMIGQTTIGPWQITLANASAENLGAFYGVPADMSEDDVFAFCTARPAVQCGMICDYIQRAYSTLGRRSPYAIQSYFWLAAFVKGEIGQGAWDKSVLPVAPDNDWTKLTPAMKADTGFYAKQILLGTKGNPNSLVYWLWTSGDDGGIAQVLRVWRSQRKRLWDEAAEKTILTEESGGFEVKAEDLLHIPDERCRAAVAGIIAEL